MNKLRLLLLVPLLGLTAACGALSFSGTCSDNSCTGNVAPLTGTPHDTPKASPSIPGAEPTVTVTSPGPTVTQTVYVQQVQQCLPDPTVQQLDAMAQGSIPQCLPVADVQVFVTLVNDNFRQLPPGYFDSQQHRDHWRDHDLVSITRQADNQ